MNDSKELNIRIYWNNQQQFNHLRKFYIKSNEIFDNFYDLKQLNLSNTNHNIFKAIMNQLVIECWKNKIDSTKIYDQKIDRFQFVTHCVKLSKHGIIVDSLLLITSKHVLHM